MLTLPLRSPISQASSNADAPPTGSFDKGYSHLFGGDNLTKFHIGEAFVSNQPLLSAWSDRLHASSRGNKDSWMFGNHFLGGYFSLILSYVKVVSFFTSYK